MKDASFASCPKATLRTCESRRGSLCATRNFVPDSLLDETSISNDALQREERATHVQRMQVPNSSVLSNKDLSLEMKGHNCFCGAYNQVVSSLLRSERTTHTTLLLLARPTLAPPSLLAPPHLHVPLVDLPNITHLHRSERLERIDENVPLELSKLLLTPSARLVRALEVRARAPRSAGRGRRGRCWDPVVELQEGGGEGMRRRGRRGESDEI